MKRSRVLIEYIFEECSKRSDSVGVYLKIEKPFEMTHSVGVYLNEGEGAMVWVEMH